MVLAQRLEEPKVLQKPGREGWKLKPTPLVGDTRREKAEEGEMEAEERQSSLDRFKPLPHEVILILLVSSDGAKRQ